VKFRENIGVVFGQKSSRQMTKSMRSRAQLFSILYLFVFSNHLAGFHREVQPMAFREPKLRLVFPCERMSPETTSFTLTVAFE
jgi:hypothetical protein